MKSPENHFTHLEMTTENRDTAVIFADGAGATCIEAVESSDDIGIIASRQSKVVNGAGEDMNWE